MTRNRMTHSDNKTHSSSNKTTRALTHQLSLVSPSPQKRGTNDVTKVNLKVHSRNAVTLKCPLFFHHPCPQVRSCKCGSKKRNNNPMFSKFHSTTKSKASRSICAKHLTSTRKRSETIKKCLGNIATHP